MYKCGNCVKPETDDCNYKDEVNAYWEDDKE